jgi:hypothetical protein
MNDSEFGLTASVWTSSQKRALKICSQLNVGTVFQNRCDSLDPQLPWSGRKDSGKGISLSHLGYAPFTRTKSYNFASGSWMMNENKWIRLIWSRLFVGQDDSQDLISWQPVGGNQWAHKVRGIALTVFIKMFTLEIRAKTRGLGWCNFCCPNSSHSGVLVIDDPLPTVLHWFRRYGVATNGLLTLTENCFLIDGL